MVTKTYRYRIYPTRGQAVLLSKHFGAKRFVFNHFLHQRKSLYLTHKKSLSYFDTAKSLTQLKKQKQYAWMNEINSQTLQAALRDLDSAYNRFFRKQTKFPRFKSKKNKQSFKVLQNIAYKHGELRIPKFKQAIKVQEDRPLTGRILFAVLTKRPSGKYFVSITVATEHASYHPSSKMIGIDFGIKDIVVCSDGTSHPNIKTIKKHEKQLAYEQRQLAKKVKTSQNRMRQRTRVAKIYERISNIRHNHLHKISASIVRDNQTICCESLSVMNMMKNHCLAKAIADASWGELLRQLRYKAQWNGRAFIQIDRFFPSSKTCNKCKYINEALSLGDRSWLCPKCHSSLNRDVNAALNILEQGLTTYSGCGSQSELKQKSGEAFPLGKSENHNEHQII